MGTLIKSKWPVVRGSANFTVLIILMEAELSCWSWISGSVTNVTLSECHEDMEQAILFLCLWPIIDNLGYVHEELKLGIGVCVIYK